ncbi:response regulator transcription factor [Kordia sp. YSTF-M3]|uniref:Response regulator transcription factor n=1 Tax=Kordia aestuariivivens TaxID=2759037 RepID=A0ABR7Q3A1_9FLAO|nr:response regulator transcription factor [Kordia aestuariivivens]MBC8753041.1 response regulator transcription factor [Kordia aestuariivivens]
MNVNIIIADDHQLFIDGIKSILANEIGISIIGEATNGLVLYKLIEDGLIPDVVLTDIRMPVLDGVSVTKMLHKDFPKIKVLALSMFDQSVDVIEMLDAGAKGYVTKNAEKKTLVQAIHTVIKGEYYISENLPDEIQAWFDNEPVSTEQTLTRRENEILRLIAKGRTTIEIAKQLKISRFTIDTHRKNIHKKLGIKSNTGLVSYALKHKL